jgi:hypothetical protein
LHITASDRTNLIRLASTLPKGSEERRAILSGLRIAAEGGDEESGGGGGVSGKYLEFMDEVGDDKVTDPDTGNEVKVKSLGGKKKPKGDKWLKEQYGKWLEDQDKKDKKPKKKEKGDDEDKPKSEKPKSEKPKSEKPKSEKEKADEEDDAAFQAKMDKQNEAVLKKEQDQATADEEDDAAFQAKMDKQNEAVLKKEQAKEPKKKKKGSARSAMIRLASVLPKGSEARRDLLSQID